MIDISCRQIECQLWRYLSFEPETEEGRIKWSFYSLKEWKLNKTDIEFVSEPHNDKFNIDLYLDQKGSTKPWLEMTNLYLNLEGGLDNK